MILVSYTVMAYTVYKHGSSGRRALPPLVMISNNIANRYTNTKKCTPCWIINRVNNQRNNMKMTAKQNANAITLLMTFSISVASH